MYVTIRIRPDCVVAVRERKAANPGVSDVLRTIEALAGSLHPLHPGIDDARLASYFQVDVPDKRTAEQLASTLRANPVVEAAYVKPREEMA